MSISRESPFYYFSSYYAVYRPKLQLPNLNQFMLKDFSYLLSYFPNKFYLFFYLKGIFSSFCFLFWGVGPWDWPILSSHVWHGHNNIHLTTIAFLLFPLASTITITTRTYVVMVAMAMATLLGSTMDDPLGLGHGYPCSIIYLFNKFLFWVFY